MNAIPTNDVIAGPAYADFPLTLSSGYREEAVSPFFYWQNSDGQSQWAIPPFFCRTKTPDVDWSEWDFFYPVITYRRFGTEGGLQIAQIFSFGAGENQTEKHSKRFTIFPIYFQSRSQDTNLNYTALLPFYGHLRNRLFHDQIDFVMFPFYAHTVKKDVVTDNFLYPIFDKRHGDQLTGWQAWPFYGEEHKGLTYKTNQLGQAEPIGGYDKYFATFPFYFRSHEGLGTTNVSDNITIVPFYNASHSPNRDMTCYGWPFGVNIIDDRVKGYHERDIFWPAVVTAHGSKEEQRIFPFYSRARNEALESDFYMWPLYKFNRLHSPPLDRTRTRIIFFLYSDIRQRNTQTGDLMRRVDFWPFYTFHRDIEGTQRLQALALLEPFFPNNRAIRREYSPVWSFWTAEKNPKTGASNQSLLWNFYRREKTRESTKISLLFGLIQRQATADGARWRLFYLPSFGGKHGKNG